MKISRLSLASFLSIAGLVTSDAHAAELKVVDASGSTRLVADVSGQGRNAIEVIAKNSDGTTSTEGAEVQLANLEQGNEVLSMRLSGEGRGYFNAVPAGSFKVTALSTGVEIESVQLAKNDDDKAAAILPAGEGGAVAGADAGVAGTEAAAAGGGGAAAGGTSVAGAGFGLGAGGIVLAGAGAVAIGATAISEGTNDAAPGPVVPPVPSGS